ncbi:hypothetical protein [Psychromicrobium lacuslunae]|uniref:Uncharacterized protein n=1 Tax=Psychromicrobium lacuslunae TaxID=1618207 RepID=A0A0D4C0P8_9MICC|nr:hypothetical protein [Psychromicrobium lacuslunae]AJT42153.1 hypothetical protein UM93_12735 [Psychromicrobium lacuslunae]
MPSYRAVLQITGLRPGHAPEVVMKTAIETLSSIHLVEANQLDVVGRVPVITLRFLVETSTDSEEDAQAMAACGQLREAVEQVATTGRLTTLRRRGGKWLFVG